MTSPEPETDAVQSTPLLNAALAAFQAVLPHVEASEIGDAGSYQYKYAGLGRVSRTVLPKLAAQGLSFSAYPTVNDRGQFVLRYELLHKSGESKTGEYPISGGNAQAIGSSITYARRYSLCAVTGVAPDADDDDAAANVQAQTEFPDQPSELQNAREAVRGAWAFHYGEFIQSEASAAYKAWSKGGALTAADPAELRKFAAYLSTLPKVDAGGDPAEQLASRADDGPRAVREMTQKMRGRVFAELTQRYTERQDQLTFLRSVLGREITSRGDLTYDDAKVLIDVFESEAAQ